MKKKWISFLLAFVMAYSCVSCSQLDASSLEKEETGSASVSGSAGTGGEQSAFPVTVTDAAGREVTIQSQPEKLVSGYYIATSMLLALGQREKLVGIEAKADTRPIYSLAAPELLNLPNVGTAKAFDLEGCTALQPDLIILPLKLKEHVPALEELGFTVLMVNPESLAQLNETILLLGTAVGAQIEAKALLDYNRATEAFLNNALSGTDHPSVYLAGNSSYLSTAGGKMYQNSLLELGGGKNVADSLADSYWAETSYEQLLAWNPEVIIMASDASYSKEDLLQDPQLAQLDAVQNGRVYAMPSGLESWDSPVPSALVGSRWLASVLHEELYSFEEFQADAAAFYQTFYQIQIEPQLLAR